MRETVLEAVLRSADAPSEAQRNRFAAFLKKQCRTDGQFFCG